MTILITGGAGFIGSHLCEALLKQGYRVVNVDNFNDYYDPSTKEQNVEETFASIKEHKRDDSCYTVKNGDIRDIDFLEQVFAENRINMIIHLAAMAGVRPSIALPVLYNDVNINGTLNLLEMSRKYGIDKFLFASSSSVYGNNDKVPFTEADNVDYPISPYAATKKAGELICHTYHHLYNIDMACLRFFTVYGPRQRPDLAIHKFTRLILNNEEIPFYGDGTTERDYTYIDDIIDGISKAVNWVEAGKDRYEIFNLGESRTITLKKMVKTIENALGRKARLKRLPMQPGDVRRTYADISKAREMLGYNPATEFEEGIERFVNWYRKASNYIPQF